MSKDVVIDLRKLTKVFRDFWLRARVVAVDGVSLQMASGEVLGLLGPNGSGKSTTIKMMLGLLFPTSGTIEVFGRSPGHVDTKRRIGYVPEESYLYPFLNAQETLDYYGRLFGLDASERRERTATLLDMVGLTEVASRRLGEYSKGMQRRINVAQALINDPDLLILDEPTTGLDPIGTRQIKDLILALRDRGKSILLSSHLLADVEDVCDRMAFLYGGKVHRVGTVDELLTVSGNQVLETDVLPESVTGEIRGVIEGAGHTVHRVSQPRRRLEEVFLEIVEAAQREGVATSGAAAGSALSGFLARGASSLPTAPPEADASPPQSAP